MKNQLDGPFRVYIGLVDQGYLNQAALSETIKKGIEFCQIKGPLQGSVVIEPETIAIDNQATVHSYTNPALIDSLLATLKQAPYLKEDCTLLCQTNTILTETTGGLDLYKKRGYYSLKVKYPHLNIESISNSTLTKFLLSKNPSILHEVVTSHYFSNPSLLIYVPKIHHDFFTDGFSGAIAMGQKNIYHSKNNPRNYKNISRQVIDLLEVASPHLIVSDGIVVPWGSHELTKTNHELGVVIVANNALAHDIVAAKILGMEAEKIEHLKLAMHYGWGPNSFHKIQLGGAGLDGIELLKSKTIHWGNPPSNFEDIKEVSLPFQIQSRGGFSKTGVHGIFFKWLQLLLEKKSQKIKRSRSTVVLDFISEYPKHKTVYYVGNEAIRSIKQKIDSIYLDLSFKNIRMLFCKLKNKKNHLCFLIPGQPPSEEAISLAFTLGSFGRLKTNPWKFSKLEKKPPALADTALNKHPIPVIRTTELPQNKWWSTLY